MPVTPVDDHSRFDWQPVALAVSLAVAGVFVLTWLLPMTRASWDQLDLLVFRSLNGSLALGPSWQRFWAVANWRGFDAISGTIMLLIVWRAFHDRQIHKSAAAWVSFGVLAAAILVMRQIVAETIINHWLQYHRPSPTLVLAKAWRLSELIPEIRAKDASQWSFPGDHGFVLISIALYLSYVGSPKSMKLAAFAATIFTLPRLIAGAALAHRHPDWQRIDGSDYDQFAAGNANPWLARQPHLGWDRVPSLGGGNCAKITAARSWKVSAGKLTKAVGFSSWSPVRQHRHHPPYASDCDRCR